MSNRLLVFDSVRGLMALTVAAFHFMAPNHLFHGALAVDVFFIMSGVVISLSYQHLVAEEFSLFVSKRLKRLYPLHAFSLVLVIVLFLISVCFNLNKTDDLFQAIRWQFPQDYYQDGVWFSLLQSFLLLNCVGFNPTRVYWNGPSWSISVEFWINLIYFKYLRQLSSFAYILIVLGCYIVVYNVSGGLDVHHKNVFGFINQGLLRGCAGFLLGVLIFRHVRFCEDVSMTFMGSHVVTIAKIFLLVVIFLIMYQPERDSLDFVGAGCAAAFIALCFKYRACFFSKIMSIKPLVYLGTISYSIYLLHYPLQYLLQNIFHTQNLFMYFCLLLIFASFSYFYIEKRYF